MIKNLTLIEKHELIVWLLSKNKKVREIEEIIGLDFDVIINTMGNIKKYEDMNKDFQ